MKLINGILYIEWVELINSKIPEGTLKSATARKTNNWVFIKDPVDNRRSLAEFEKLTQEVKRKITVQYGDPYKYVSRKPILDMVILDKKAELFYMSYRYGEDKILPTDKVNKYAQAASWLNMLVKFNQDKRAVKKLLNISVTEFFSQVCELIKNLQIELPTTYRKLHPKIKQYETEGYACLISGRFGNTNTAKIKDELSKSVLLELLCHPNQYDDVFICQAYNKWAQESGYPPIVSATVGIHRRENEPLIIAFREGDQAFIEKYQKQVKGFRPSFPLAMVENDDNHIDLQFIDLEIKNKFARYKAVVVIDSFNDYVLGYAYTTEAVTTELVRAAYVNAMYHIRSLTKGWYLPCEVKADNFGIATLQPYYESIGKFIKTPVGSKHRGYIEPFFGSHHWKRCLKIGANNYTGNNLTALTRGVNMEVVNANINNRPILGIESINQVEQFFHRLRYMPNDKGVSKNAQWLDAWENTPEEKKRPISDEQFLLTFGIEHNHHGKGIKITNRGVEPRINGKRSFDMAIYKIEDVGKPVSIYYDPYDMSRVLVTDHESVRMLAFDAKLSSRAMEDAQLDSRTYLNSIFKEKQESFEKVSKASKKRKEVIKLVNTEAETLLVSGVMDKEIKMAAEQKYLEQSNSYYADEDEEEESIFQKILKR